MHTIPNIEDYAWQHPDSYAGFSPDGDYCVASLMRDATLLDKSNWNYFDQQLEPLEIDPARFAQRPQCYVWRAGSSMCGWIDYMMVRRDAPRTLIDRAVVLLDRLQGYPVLDDDDYSMRQHEAVYDYWEHLSDDEKVDLCVRAGAPMEATHDIPSEVYDDLMDSELTY